MGKDFLFFVRKVSIVTAVDLVRCEILLNIKLTHCSEQNDLMSNIPLGV